MVIPSSTLARRKAANEKSSRRCFAKAFMHKFLTPPSRVTFIALLNRVRAVETQRARAEGNEESFHDYVIKLTGERRKSVTNT